MTTPKHKAVFTIPSEGDDYELRIFPDEDVENPDTLNEECFIMFDHSDFNIKSKIPHMEPFDVYKKVSTMKPIDLLSTRVYNIDEYYVIQLYALIHSGVKLSIDKLFDPWDVSDRGYIFYKIDNYTIEYVIEYCRNHINMWNHYNNGNVYRFELVKIEICSYCHNQHEILIDSCGGFYPNDSIIVDMIASCETMVKLDEKKVNEFKNTFL